MGKAVQLVNITKKFGNRTVVDKVSLEIKKGEVFGLLGPNGAGKTTIIQMIVGLISTTSGQILVNGKDIQKDFLKAIANIGAVIENPALYKFMTGFQNLRHYASMYPMISEGKIDEVVSIVGLENRIHDKVKNYSLGMKQRLGLAQAILHRPSLLILDEPTNGLDPAGIKHLREYLRKLALVENVTVLVSSHLLAEMELMCDRFAILQNGKLVKTQVNSSLSKIDEEMPVIILTDKPLEAKRIINAVMPFLSVQVVEHTLEVITNHETIPQIASLLVKEEIKIYGIKRRTKSLEDIFMETTGRE